MIQIQKNSLRNLLSSRSLNNKLPENNIMKTNLFTAVFFTAFFAIAVNAQIVPPPPAPGEDSIKISTTLIQVDVTVTDKKGNIVTDLKPEEIEIYENGVKQDVSAFSFINAETGEKTIQTPSNQKTANGKDAIPTPPVKLKPEEVRRTYALVVDDLGLNFGNIYWVRQSLRKFVNEQMQDGDLVAIVRTGSGIGALQSFTSDKRQLLAAIDKIKWNPHGRSGISTFNPIGTTLRQDLDGTVKSDGSVSTVAGTDEEIAFQKQLEQYRNENFSAGTLGALNYIIRGMRELPGRKAIMLFSEGFVISGLEDRVLDSMRVLADLANRSSVVIYTLDPRGLQVPMFEAQDTVRDIFDSRTITAINQRTDDFTKSQSSLRYLADETGGFAFVNQNNINKGLQEAIADQSGYYLLGYQPDEKTFDPKNSKYNKLEIKVLRPGLKVRYRSGFFGITDEKIQNATKQTPQQTLVSSLISPFGASDISLNLYSVFYNDDKKKNVIRSFVFINPNDLTFTPDSEGMYQAKFSVIAAIFDTDGASADNGVGSQTLRFTKEQLEKVKKTGIIYDLPVVITKLGSYQFRLALRDETTGKIGAVNQFIEIPNVKKNLALSGIILNNFTVEQWEKVKLGGPSGKDDRSVLLDTTLRRFERGTILRYDSVVYNPKSSRKIQTRIRLIRDGKVVYEEQPTGIKTAGQNDLSRLQIAGALTLGKNLEPGNYVLQIVASEKTNEKKFAAQFVEFEIIE